MQKCVACESRETIVCATCRRSFCIRLHAIEHVRENPAHDLIKCSFCEATGPSGFMFHSSPATVQVCCSLCYTHLPLDAELEFVPNGTKAEIQAALEELLSDENIATDIAFRLHLRDNLESVSFEKLLQYSPKLLQIRPQQAQLMLALMASKKLKVANSRIFRASPFNAQKRALRIFGLNFPQDKVAEIVNRLTLYQPYFVRQDTYQTYKFFYVMFKTEQEAIHVYRSMGTQKYLSPYRIYQSQLVKDIEHIDRLKNCLVVLPNFADKPIEAGATLSACGNQLESQSAPTGVSSSNNRSFLLQNEIDVRAERGEKALQVAREKREREESVVKVRGDPTISSRTLAITARPEQDVRKQVEWRTGFTCQCIDDEKEGNVLATFESEGMALLALQLLSEWQGVSVCLLTESAPRSAADDTAAGERRRLVINEQTVNTAHAASAEIEVAVFSKPETAPSAKALQTTRAESKTISLPYVCNDADSDDLSISALAISLAFK